MAGFFSVQVNGVIPGDLQWSHTWSARLRERWHEAWHSPCFSRELWSLRLRPDHCVCQQQRTGLCQMVDLPATRCVRK